LEQTKVFNRDPITLGKTCTKETILRLSDSILGSKSLNHFVIKQPVDIQYGRYAILTMWFTLTHSENPYCSAD